MNHILTKIVYERARQDKKWGIQNHPDGTGEIFYGDDLAFIRRMNETAVEQGKITWDLILLEEVYEALCETDPEKLKEELTQVAAVAIAWIEKIDRDLDNKKLNAQGDKSGTEQA